MKIVLQQATERIWYHKDFYESLIKGLTLTDIDSPRSVKAPVNKTVQEPKSDTNLIKVTHMLIPPNGTEKLTHPYKSHKKYNFLYTTLRWTLETSHTHFLRITSFVFFLLIPPGSPFLRRLRYGKM